MDFTFIAFSAAKSNWIRIAISLFLLTSPICAEGPVTDFFLKENKKASDKKKTPIRDFFFKNSKDQEDIEFDEEESCEEWDCEGCPESSHDDCDCCN